MVLTEPRLCKRGEKTLSVPVGGAGGEEGGRERGRWNGNCFQNTVSQIQGQNMKRKQRITKKREGTRTLLELLQTLRMAPKQSRSPREGERSHGKEESHESR